MIDIFEAARQLQVPCDRRGWRSCFIGGVAVQRRGEPRVTRDVDLTQPQDDLHKDVTDLLKEHKASQNGNPCDLVFATSTGTPIERHNITRAMKRLIGVANEGVEEEGRRLPLIRLYDLRHTAATLALAASVTVKVVSEMLGHVSAALMLDVYSHVLPHMLADAGSALKPCSKTPIPSRDRKIVTP